MKDSKTKTLETLDQADGASGINKLSGAIEVPTRFMPKYNGYDDPIHLPTTATEIVTNQDLQGGYKADSGKPRFGLIPPTFLRALAELFTMGAKKYSDWNWCLGMKYSRVYDAMMRHSNAWWGGEKLDQVDKQHHLISVAWCACVLYIYDTVSKFTQFDDRPHTLTDEHIRESINRTATN